MNNKVVLGMSGGVDSSVAACLLMENGYEVYGCTALFNDDEASRQAIIDAAQTCELLGIQHCVYDATGLFEKEVIQNFVNGYEQGITPSPCVVCNRECKIPVLLRVAEEKNCDFIATGHYAQIVHDKTTGEVSIQKAQDPKKDQSYMLAQLPQSYINSLLLPLGKYTKSQIRALAAERNLACAKKAESQDICFIKDNYENFLDMRNISSEKGNIVNSSGEVLGRHEGLYRYTIGQRKGIGIAAREPLYVIGKDIEQNALIVGFKNETFISAVLVDDMEWQCGVIPQEIVPICVKLRYRSNEVSARFISKNAFDKMLGLEYFKEEIRQFDKLCELFKEDSQAFIILDEPQTTTAPGQYAVFYQDDVVLGSGCITEVFSAR